MKKKGFTLIELLAVIVILAIIALIATPLVLKYIETARTNSKITSTHNYMKAVENALASYSITNKGKRYPEGCYEISTLNIDLDISMKGNMPSEGKVCIEDNKIKKSILKYPDNKVIKYENDKLTVSDEETFESFNSASNYIIDADVEFAYNESSSQYEATLQITKDIADKFEIAMDYDFIIDGEENKTVASFNYQFGFMIYSYINDESELSEVVGAIIDNEKITFASAKELIGIHNVKIGNSRPIKEKTYFSVDEYGEFTIVGYNFVEGNAKIIIKDEEIEFFNNTVVFEDYEGDRIIGVDWGCRNNLGKLIPEAYNAITDGKTLTIEITQTVDGKEVVSKISKNLNSVYVINNIYFSKTHPFIIFGGGC